MAVALALLLVCSDPMAEGIKALDARNYAAAVEWFSKVIASDPKDYAGHFHLALAYTLMGREVEAIPAYKKVLELKPGLYEAELNLGLVLLGQKQAEAALPYLQGAAEKKPDQFRAQLNLAEALLATGDFAKAEQRFQTALALDSKSAPAELGLARSQARQQRLASAAPHFRRAHELDASYSDALLELAALYEAAKQPDPAIALYARFPDNVGAQERLGVLLIETKRYPEAIACLEKVSSREPTAANLLALANAYRLNGEPAKALPRLERAAALQPGYYELRMLYGAMLRDQKQYAPAAREFLAAARIHPESKEAWSELASMLILLESFPQALAALDRLKALGAETPAHHFFRAIIFDKTKQYQPALSSYQKFLAEAGGKFPDEEFQARQRVRIIQKELNRR